MNERLSCTSPGCRRTAARKGKLARAVEWICPKHWAQLTKVEKRVWARFRREQRKFGFSPRPVAYERIWLALKRRAR